MDRWSGIMKIQLHQDSSTFYRVAASLGLSSSPKKLAVPSGNVIFFNGDRVEGTENPVIERLSNPQSIVEILVSKFGGSVNAFVVEAPIYNGPFAVYKDFIASVNERGEPNSYDATGFPASSSLVLLLSKIIAEIQYCSYTNVFGTSGYVDVDEVLFCNYFFFRKPVRHPAFLRAVFASALQAKNVILGKQKETDYVDVDVDEVLFCNYFFFRKPVRHPAFLRAVFASALQAKNVILGKQKETYPSKASTSVTCKPTTALLGFSKGGTVLNQLITEFGFSEIQSTEFQSHATKEDDWIIPTTKECLFNSIAEIHYVDVGLNTEGAYLTNEDVIDRISKHLSKRAFGIRFLFHGTPRQWHDERRIWLRKEKDTLVHLLKNAARRNMGKLHLRERLYFPRKLPDLQMHFEIIDVLDVS